MNSFNQPEPTAALINHHPAGIGAANPRLRITYRAVSELRKYERNARTHSKAQIRKIADSIRQFGFTNPVLIDKGTRSSLAAAELRPRSCLELSKFQQSVSRR